MIDPDLDPAPPASYCFCLAPHNRCEVIQSRNHAPTQRLPPPVCLIASLTTPAALSSPAAMPRPTHLLGLIRPMPGQATQARPQHGRDHNTARMQGDNRQNHTYIHPHTHPHAHPTPTSIHKKTYIRARTYARTHIQPCNASNPHAPVTQVDASTSRTSCLLNRDDAITCPHVSRLLSKATPLRTQRTTGVAVYSPISQTKLMERYHQLPALASVWFEW